VRKLLQAGLPILVLLVGVAGAWLLMANRPRAETRQPEPEPPLIRVVTVFPQDVRLTVESRGTVQPHTASTLVAEVAGRVTWASPSFAAGGFFQEGEKLLQIDDAQYRLAVVRSRAEIAQAEVALATEREQAELARREWQELGEGTPAPLALRIPQMQQAEAALESAQAALGQAELDLARTTVQAPYAGRIREKLADVGQFVGQGAVLAEIYAAEYAEIRLPVPDHQLPFVPLPLTSRNGPATGTGPRVNFRAAFAGREHMWKGRIVRTEGQVDPATQVLHVVARVEDPYAQRGARPPLAVGMFVQGEIEGYLWRNTYVVPRAGLYDDSTVIVVDEHDRLRFRKVAVLRRTGDTAVVTSGLEPGSRIAVSVIETPTDGMRVRTTEAEEPPAGATGIRAR
jgi:RND family efflux transporter MFP subunit